MNRTFCSADQFPFTPQMELRQVWLGLTPILSGNNLDFGYQCVGCLLRSMIHAINSLSNSLLDPHPSRAHRMGTAGGLVHSLGPPEQGSEEESLQDPPSCQCAESHTRAGIVLGHRPLGALLLRRAHTPGLHKACLCGNACL